MHNEPVTPHPNTDPRPSATGGGASVGKDVNTQGGDFVGRDQTIQGDYVQGDKVTLTGAAAVQAERNRTAMLRLVNYVWVEGVLDQSLAGSRAIPIGMQKRMAAVDRSAWSGVISLPPQPDQPLPAGTPIAGIFAQMNHSLLILGQPGAGKTILLLMLARDTIAQAARDARRPIPVVLNLSAWGTRRLPFAAWLVEELRGKYNIPKRIAGEWVARDDLLLLLDGLDEMPAHYRDDCVQAINQFRQEHLAPMAVCCRLSDYEALPVKLKLNGAVVLQDLTPEQVDHYLLDAGPGFAGLREALQKESVLQELAQTPLMLNIMTLAYQDLSSEALDAQPADSTEAQRQHLFDAYVDRMFNRIVRAKQERYTPAQTIHWLRWLARMLIAHGQSTFLIEELQDSSLAAGRRRILCRVGSRLAGGLALLLAGMAGALAAVGILSGGDVRALAAESGNALLFGMAYALNFGVASLLVVRLSPALALLLTCGLAALAGTLLTGGSLLLGLSFALLFGLPGGFAGIALANTPRIELSEPLRWSWRRGLPGLLLGILLSVGGGLLMSDLQKPFSFLANLLALGPPLALTGALLAGLRRTEVIGARLWPNQGFFQARRNALWLGAAVLIAIVLGSLSIGLFQPTILARSLAIGVSFGLPLAVSTALYAGGAACLQHIVLRLFLVQQGSIPWNLAHFLDWAVQQIFLRRTGGGYTFLHRTLMEYFSKK